MARETKLERLARENEERQAHYDHLRNEYPAELMAVMNRATVHHNFELVVVKTSDSYTFNLYDRDETVTYILPESWLNSDSTWAVDFLKSELDCKDREKAEQRRRLDLHQSAMSKLTEEEKKVLDLVFKNK